MFDDAHDFTQENLDVVHFYRPRNYFNSRSVGGVSAAHRRPAATRLIATEQLHAHHRTQEEDVVSNWLLSAAEDDPGADPKQVMDRLFARTVSRQWGMSHPERSDGITLQNIDYRHAKPAKYADAWVVPRGLAESQ